MLIIIRSICAPSELSLEPSSNPILFSRFDTLKTICVRITLNNRQLALKRLNVYQKHLVWPIFCVSKKWRKNCRKWAVIIIVCNFFSFGMWSIWRNFSIKCMQLLEYMLEPCNMPKLNELVMSNKLWKCQPVKRGSLLLLSLWAGCMEAEHGLSWYA